MSTTFITRMSDARPHESHRVRNKDKVEKKMGIFGKKKTKDTKMHDDSLKQALEESMITHNQHTQKSKIG